MRVSARLLSSARIRDSSFPIAIRECRMASSSSATDARTVATWRRSRLFTRWHMSETFSSDVNHCSIDHIELSKKTLIRGFFFNV